MTASMTTSLIPTTPVLNLSTTTLFMTTGVIQEPTGITVLNTVFPPEPTDTPTVALNLIFTFENASATCENLVQWGQPLQPNPDVSGLGVILAFIISAYIIVLWAIYAYMAGLLPAELLRRGDRLLFHAHSRRAGSSWRKTLEKAAVIFGDMQIITGIGIMVAGYASLPGDLSAYHWQIVIYLGWMSSNVHLCTLSLLRPWLQKNPGLRQWRILGMLVLLGILLVALIPTVNQKWLEDTALNAPGDTDNEYVLLFDMILSSSDESGLGVPARCFWEYAFTHAGQDINWDAVCSYVFLVVGYMWKIGQLYDLSSNYVIRRFRDAPQRFVERMARASLRDSSRYRYHVTMLVYIPFVAYCEFWDSFASTLWVLVFGLIWGCIQIFVPRTFIDPSIIEAEEVWGFGQILPMMLLLQPAAAIFEHFRGGPDKTMGWSRSPTSTSLASHKSTKSHLPASPSVEPKKPRILFRVFSDTLRDSERELSMMDDTNKITVTVESLYQTRLFQSTLLWIHISAAVMICVVSWASTAYLQVWYYGLIAAAACVGWVCLVWVPFMSLRSRAFR